uniref:Uncharacterized protein n=1 Tax=Anguilla anguilla TaxID=7936 RepID=A0A0E9PMX0_ANGAN
MDCSMKKSKALFNVPMSLCLRPIDFKKISRPLCQRKQSPI